jgi:hypothetical protein
VVSGKTSPSPIDLLENDEFEKTAKKLQNKLLRSQLRDKKADRQLRDTYANRILKYLEYYSFTVWWLVMAQAWHIDGFDLPPEVVSILVGSTAVAAIGLVGFVAKGLFRTPRD